MQRKFKTIYSALNEKKDDPVYSSTVSELKQFLDMNLSELSLSEIQQVQQNMFKLDSTLPNIEDVEDLLSAVRFE